MLLWGNVTDCHMCLDSDYFDLWRSCGDCSIIQQEPECQLECTYCLAGEGIDTAELPAPRADQQIMVPSDGCSVDRRDFELECRPQSKGRCESTLEPSTVGIGCQPCYDSEFINQCDGCTLNGCLLACDSCLQIGTVNNRSGGARTTLTIPPGGCHVSSNDSILACDAGSEGSCPLEPVPHPPQHLADWKIGVAVAGSLLGAVLLAVLLVLLWRRRTSNIRAKKASAMTKTESDFDSSGVSSNYASRYILPTDISGGLPVPDQFNPEYPKLAIPVQQTQSLQIPSFGTPKGTPRGTPPGSGMTDRPQYHDRLVHASVLDAKDIQMCKKPDGKDWLLGRGSYGMVYKAKMGELEVAVKTIHRQYVNPQLTPQQALDVIGQELKILEMLPYDRRVVEYYGSCNQDGNILLVLEFMQGGDLWHAMHNHETGPGLKWYKGGAQIALDIINGLHFLHSHFVVHRDVKSANVLLSEDFQSAKVCDVGLARIMGGSTLSSSSHNVHATFAYAAPEIILCERSDHRTDIFSYGVVLWEIITQEHPQRGNMRDLQVPEDCSQAIKDIHENCLNKDPAHRPTHQQIIEAIEACIAESAATDVRIPINNAEVDAAADGPTHEADDTNTEV